MSCGCARASSLLAPCIALLGALAFQPVGATTRSVPFLGGRVNDYAELLSEPERERLEARLTELETATGAQVSILTVTALEGEPIEELSMRVAETWKLGRKDHDDGVLVVVARRDRRMRIEVGYGLEGVLPDAVCSRIIDGIMRPRFREGDYGKGLLAAADALAAAIGGDAEAVEAIPGNEEGSEPPLMARIAITLFVASIVGFFSLLGLLAKGGSGWFLYLFMMPFYLMLMALAGPIIGGLLLLAWLLGFPLFRAFFHKRLTSRGFLKAHPRWAGLAKVAASSRSRSGGWSSGGGFSGGGGSFGGGGSSGSW